MPPFRLKATMVAFADALMAGDPPVVTVAHPRPTKVADVGEAIVGYPTEIAFDVTFGRGADRAVFPVWVIAGIMDAEETQDTLDRLLSDEDDAVKTALEAEDALGDTVQTVRATRAAIESVVLASGIEYAAVRHDVEVIS